MSWKLRNMASNARPKGTRSANCYPNLTMRHWSPSYQRIKRLTDHHVDVTKRQLEPNTSPHYLAAKTKTQQLGDTHMTFGMTWKTEQDKTDRSMDRGGVPRCTMMATRPDVTNITTSRPKTTDEFHPSYGTTCPDIGVPHTPYVSLMRCWTMNFQRDSNP